MFNLKFRTLGRSAAMVLVTATLGACSLFQPKMNITDLAQVKPGEVVIVGRISMEPPITKDDQFIDILATKKNKDMMRNAFYMVSGDQLLRPDELDYPTRNDHYAKFNEDFYFAVEKGDPFFISGIGFYTYLTSKRMEVTTMPAQVQLDLTKKKRYFYLGNLTYVRDEFFNIKEIKHDFSGYNKANQEFKKKYNTKDDLVKVKIKDAS